MSDNLTTAPLYVVGGGQDQTLQNIEQLQQMEKNLYAQLESISANSGNANEQEKIIKRINELSEMRMNMFKSLTGMYDSLLQNVSETRVGLVDQITVVGVVENELNNAKSNLNNLQDAKNNKMRMVEINTYYGQRYQAHTSVMKLIIMITIPLLILAILRKKQLIPSSIASGLTTIILIIGGFLFIRRVYDLYTRDNMNYDEYNWKFDPSKTTPTVYEYDREHLKGTKIRDELRNAADNLANNIGLGCVGASCCSRNMTYNKNTHKCVEDASSTTASSTTEGFKIRDNVSYVVTKNPCSTNNNAQNIKSFSPFEDNYSTV